MSVALTESSLSSIYVGLQWLACDLPFFPGACHSATAYGGHKE